MITAFAGSKAAEAFLLHVNWRWGFACFAIIVPAVTFPLFLMLKMNLRKAEKQGLYKKAVKDRATLESVWKQIVAFDCELLPHSSNNFPFDRKYHKQLLSRTK